MVPLYVVFGGDRTVRETDITDYAAFFEELRSAESLPTTSQPSVGDFMSVYEPLLADGGDDRLDPHLGRAVGHARVGAPGAGGARARRQGRRADAGGRLRRPPPAGSGCWCSRPRAAAARGAGADEVERARRGGARRAEDVVRDRHARVPQRGGRIGAASAWIGSTLKVKPILTVENEMAPVERVRTSARVFERLVDYAAPAPRVGRRRAGRSSTSTRPSRRAARRRAAARSSGTSR